MFSPVEKFPSLGSLDDKEVDLTQLINALFDPKEPPYYSTTEDIRTSSCLRIFPKICCTCIKYVSSKKQIGSETWSAVERQLKIKMNIEDFAEPYFTQDFEIVRYMTKIMSEPKDTALPNISTLGLYQQSLLTAILEALFPLGRELVPCHSIHHWLTEMDKFQCLQRILPAVISQQEHETSKVVTILKWRIASLMSQPKHLLTKPSIQPPHTCYMVATRLVSVANSLAKQSMGQTAVDLQMQAVEYYQIGIQPLTTAEVNKALKFNYKATSESKVEDYLKHFQACFSQIQYSSLCELKAILVDLTLREPLAKYIAAYENQQNQFNIWQMAFMDWRKRRVKKYLQTTLNNDSIRHSLMQALFPHSLTNENECRKKINNLDETITKLATNIQITQATWFEQAEATSQNELIKRINACLRIFNTTRFIKLRALTNWLHQSCWFAMDPRNQESCIAEEMTLRLFTNPNRAAMQYAIHTFYTITDWAAQQIHPLLNATKHWLLKLHPDKHPQLLQAFMAKYFQQFNQLRIEATQYATMWNLGQWSMENHSGALMIKAPGQTSSLRNDYIFPLDFNSLPKPSCPTSCECHPTLDFLQLQYDYFDHLKNNPYLIRPKKTRIVPHRYHIYPTGGENFGRHLFESSRLTEETREIAKVQAQCNMTSMKVALIRKISKQYTQLFLNFTELGALKRQFRSTLDELKTIYSSLSRSTIKEILLDTLMSNLKLSAKTHELLKQYSRESMSNSESALHSPNPY
ncbi:MAG: hypothetical protein A3F18_01365 [Legionellales bacterium RIFCSPHIGHO2_12_FULL_37_14]|nr:MAG: hypothetical protein A3F18_01365 [Legionellales bacterium RIFCSPHIGHO2_12_FULL_37_14]